MYASIHFNLEQLAEGVYTAIARGDSVEAVASTPIPAEYMTLDWAEVWEDNLRKQYERLAKDQD